MHHVTLIQEGITTGQAGCLAAWLIGCALVGRHYLRRWAKRIEARG